MPSDNFSRPTGGRKKLKKAPITDTRPARTVTRAPVSDVRSSGPDYGKRAAEVYKQGPEYRRIQRQVKAKVDRDKRALVNARAAAAAANAYQPFDPVHVKRAIELGLPEADSLWIDSKGFIQKHLKASALPFGLGDSLVADSDVVLDPHRGGDPRPKLYGADGKKAGIDAAGQKLLEQTLRPLHGVVEAIDAGAHGKSPISGFGRGFVSGKKTFKDLGLPGGVAFAADVLLDPTTYVTAGAGGVGRKLAVREGEQAAKAAAKASTAGALRAEAATAKGVSGRRKLRRAKKLTAQAERHASQAEKLSKVREKAERSGTAEHKGIQVGARLPGGRHVETSGRLTAKVAKGKGPVKPGKVARKVRESRPVQRVAPALAPDFRVKGVSDAEHAAARAADRQHRARRALADRRAEDVYRSTARAVGRDKGERKSQALAAAIERAPKPTAEFSPGFDVRASAKSVRRQVRKTKNERVRRGSTAETKKLRAVERKIERDAAARPNAVPLVRYGRPAAEGGARFRPRDLGGDLGAVATNTGRVLRKVRDEERTAGIGGSARTFYLPHTKGPRETVEDFEARQAQATRRGRSFAHNRRRAIEGTLAEIEQRFRDVGLEMPFDRNVPRVVATRVQASGHAIAHRKYIEDLANTGTRIRDSVHVAPGHVPYVLVERGKGSKEALKPLIHPDGTIDHAAVRSAVASGAKVYSLNPKVIEPRLAQLAQGVSRTDKFTKAWKFWVTVPWPSYHLGNLVGDSILAWQADTSAVNFLRALKAVNELRRIEAHGRSAAAAKGVERESVATVRVLGADVPLEQELARALDAGALPAGFSTHDVRAPGEAFAHSRSPTEALRHASELREWFPRFATWLEARNRGMTDAAAAEYSGKHMIDYGDLSKFEEQVRSAFLIGIPFYTFWARNSRLQLTKLFTRPGKAATFEKAREEAVNSLGLSMDEFEDKLRDYQKRGMPFPLDLGQKMLLFAKTPIDQGLGQLPIVDSANPVGSSLRDVGRNVINHTGPWKMLVEIPANYSFFFAEPIEDARNNTVRVPAPGFMKWALDHDPTGFVSHVLHVEVGSDGKAYWPGTVDYIAKAMPESKLLLDLTTAEKNRHGKPPWMTAAASLGAKLEPMPSGTENRLDEIYGRLRELDHEVARLRTLKLDRNKQRTQYTPAYRKVLDEQAELRERLEKLKAKLGEKPDRRVLRRRSSGPKLPSGLSDGLSSGLSGGL